MITTWALFGLCLGLAATLLWRQREHACKHQYVEYARTYVPPAPESALYWLSSSERSRARAGFTTIFFRCAVCPAAHCAELPGQHFGNGTVTKLRSVQ